MFLLLLVAETIKIQHIIVITIPLINSELLTCVFIDTLISVTLKLLFLNLFIESQRSTIFQSFWKDTDSFLYDAKFNSPILSEFMAYWRYNFVKVQCDHEVKSTSHFFIHSPLLMNEKSFFLILKVIEKVNCLKIPTPFLQITCFFGGKSLLRQRKNT